MCRLGRSHAHVMAQMPRSVARAAVWPACMGESVSPHAPSPAAERQSALLGSSWSLCEHVLS